jgi:hypothetical protein
MQTFLPYADFERSAEALDPRRLGKQRVEVIQIVRALTVPTYAWKSHPAVLMWEGFEEALGAYGMAMVRRWRLLGFDDTCAATIRADLATAAVPSVRTQAELAAVGALPPWLGDERLHRSHRSALVRKDPEVYRPRFPDVPDDLEYWWPVRSPKVLEAEARRRAAAAAREERAARRRSEAARKAARTRARNRSAAGADGARPPQPEGGGRRPRAGS